MLAIERRVSDFCNEDSAVLSLIRLSVLLRAEESEATVVGLAAAPPENRWRLLDRPDPAAPSELRVIESVFGFSSREFDSDFGAGLGLSTVAGDIAVCSTRVVRRGRDALEFGLLIVGFAISV